MKSKALFFLLFCFTSFCLQAQTALKDTVYIPEIIISAKTTVKVTGDTVSYTVDSFVKNPLANAEDVLKKLPGVEVGQDGKITIQGKEVSKIFINGKEYNAEDIRTITQNLPAEALEKIQVADWYDEETQHSGVRKGSQQKSINLKFKKQYEQGLLGRAAAGYGTKQRYQTGMFANVMGNDVRLTAIGNINNTGIRDATAEEDNTRQSNSSLPGQTRKKQLNLNFSYDKLKRLKLSGSYELTANHTEQTQATARTTYLPTDSALLRRQVSLQKNELLSQRLNLRGVYKVSEKLSSTTVLGLYTANRENGNNATDSTETVPAAMSNSITTADFIRYSVAANKTNAWSVDGSEMLQQKFSKKGRTASLSLSGKYNKDERDGTMNNMNEYFAPPKTDSKGFVTMEKRTGLNTRANLQYTEPLSEKSSLSARYANIYTHNENDKDVYSSAGVYDTVQSRNTENRNMENSAGINYQYSTEKFTAGAGAEVTQYNRETKIAALQYEQRGTNYFPSLYSRYKLTKKTDLNFNYNGAIISPDIRQLQPVPDYTDSLNIFIGNPGLKPELNNSASLAYNYLDPATQRTLWFSVRNSWTNRKIINRTDITASRRITIPVNEDGVYSFDISLNGTQPLLDKKIKASAGMQSGVANNITITNGVLQPVRNYNYRPSARLTFNFTSLYEGDISYAYSHSEGSGQSGFNTTLIAHTLTASGILFFPYNIKFNYYLNYVSNKGVAYRQDFLLLNASVDKSFNKPKGLSLRLQGYDVLNKYPNFTRSYGDNFFEDRTVNRLGSYYMFSIIYRFNYFSKK
jgi:hypothetical protein